MTFHPFYFFYRRWRDIGCFYFSNFERNKLRFEKIPTCLWSLSSSALLFVLTMLLASSSAFLPHVWLFICFLSSSNQHRLLIWLIILTLQLTTWALNKYLKHLGHFILFPIQRNYLASWDVFVFLLFILFLCRMLLYFWKLKERKPGVLNQLKLLWLS